jgi:hypothetical protein
MGSGAEPVERCVTAVIAVTLGAGVTGAASELAANCALRSMALQAIVHPRHKYIFVGPGLGSSRVADLAINCPMGRVLEKGVLEPNTRHIGWLDFLIRDLMTASTHAFPLEKVRFRLEDFFVEQLFRRSLFPSKKLAGEGPDGDWLLEQLGVIFQHLANIKIHQGLVNFLRLKPVPYGIAIKFQGMTSPALVFIGDWQHIGATAASGAQEGVRQAADGIAIGREIAAIQLMA